MKKKSLLMTLIFVVMILSLMVGVYASGIEIQTQPQDQVVAENENAVFTVAATGDALTYRWQYRPAGSEEWSNAGLTGCKTNAITVPATAYRNGQAYRCAITDKDGNKVFSDPAVLTLATDAVLEITSQPENVTAAIGETVTMSVGATGSGLSYQWQYCPKGSDQWTNSGLEGRKTDTLQIPVTAGRNKQSYRCIVSDNMGNSIVSEEAVLTVKGNVELAITEQPKDVSGAIGDKVYVSVEATGVDISYLWQYKVKGDSKWVRSGLDTRDEATLEIPVTKGRNGQSYRCVVTDIEGNEVISEEATLTVTAVSPIEITQQPKDAEAALGDTIHMTVKATGDSLEYQWQYLAPGKTEWANCGLEGRKTDDMTVPVTQGRDQQKYRCIITDAAGNSVISDVVTLTVGEPVVSDGFTVTFVDYDGTTIAEETVSSGGDAALPANPSRSGYYFAGWEGNYKNVTDDEIVQATYIAENASNIFMIDSVDVSKGDTATVYVHLQGDVEVVDYDMELGYDSDALEIVSVSNRKMMADTCNFVDDVIIFNYSYFENTYDEDDVISITFKVKEDTVLTDASIWFSNVKFVDRMLGGEFVEAEYHTIPGLVHIK